MNVHLTSLAVLMMGATFYGCAGSGPSAPGAPAVPPASASVSAPKAPSTSKGVAVAIPVANGGFENSGEDRPGRNCPPQWWCTMHSDPTSFRFASVAGGPSGRFLRGERVKNEPWALVTQTIPAKGLDGRILRVTSDVNTSQLKAGDGAGAGPIIRIYGPGGRVVAAEKSLRPVGAPWARASVELAVPSGAELIDIGVVMYGDGVADFDNVVAEHRPK